MAKDPAFLFYSQDFYAGTRTMLPEERACWAHLDRVHDGQQCDRRRRTYGPHGERQRAGHL